MKLSGSYSYNKLKSYLFAAKLLHFITLIELSISIFVIDNISIAAEDSSLPMVLFRLYIVCFVCSLPVLSQLDARSRYQNYKQIKDQIYFYGFNTKIVRPTIKSRCQRDAALLAAKELGFGEQCRQFFRLNGYRWYHIFPDFLFQRPDFLLTKYFWTTTFFSPTYIQRVDYSTVNIRQ